MFVTRVLNNVDVPLTEGDVFLLSGLAGQERRVVIENLDTANTLTFRFQESASGQPGTFTDIETNTPVSPGARATRILTSNVWYKMVGLGLLKVAIRLDYEVATPPAPPTVDASR